MRSINEGNGNPNPNPTNGSLACIPAGVLQLYALVAYPFYIRNMDWKLLPCHFRPSLICVAFMLVAIYSMGLETCFWYIWRYEERPIWS